MARPGGVATSGPWKISVFLSYVRFDSIPELRETRQLLGEAQASFAHGDVTPLANHEMVQRLDVKQLPSGDNLARDQHVVNIYMENHLTV